MKRHRYRSIITRITLLFLILTGVTIAIYSSIRLQRERNFFRREYQDKGETIANVIATSLLDPLYFLDIDECSNIMEAIGEDANIISSGKLYSDSGHLVADAYESDNTYSLTPSSTGVEALALDNIRFQWTPDELIVTRPIDIGRTRLGAVVIGLSADRFYELNEAIVRQSVLLSVSLVVLFGLGGFYLSRRVLRPLVELTVAVTHMEKRDFNATLPPPSNDEIGQLIDQFAEMRDSLARTYRELEISDERYALAVKGSNDGIWDWNFNTHTVFLSSRWFEILEIARGDTTVDPDEWISLIHPEDVDRFKEAVDPREKLDGELFEVEYRMKNVRGEDRWVRTRGAVNRDRQSGTFRVAGSQTDVTDWKNVESSLREAAFVDSLTGVSTRPVVFDRLQHLINKNLRERTVDFAVLFLDLDGFKSVNDTYGHDTGDLLLVETAQRLLQNVRPSDTVGRIGGDEFVVIVEQTDPHYTYENVASRIIDAVESEIEIDGERLHVSVSIGIATYTALVDSPDVLVSNADTAMYKAKQHGKGQFHFFGT